ncbi:EamA family transporter [Microcella frigidaquae]|uniref:Drug/metabolite transporter (DMT)-like permease n=1 Tax=Microcella frigidaquae TaxID=424758 RepID=A0A840X7Z3_9MICO|nr:drug/metabolite transporter (DMT)-like permease [Microcella frigidaquae]NHN45201.1 EamA family transporter [Microcella frigidaquae]
MTAALLLIGATLAHAAWNIALKSAGARGAGFLAATLLVGVVAFAPIGLPALLAGLPSTGDGLALAGLLVTGSAALQVTYFLLLQRAYRVADVGVVYPVARGTGPLLSILGALLLLGERPGPIVLLGGAFVVAGVVVIGLASAHGAGSDGAPGASRDGAAAQRRVRGVRAGALVGVVIAAYSLWDAAAVTRADLDPIGYYWASMVVQLLVFGVLVARRPVALADARAHALADARAHPWAVLVVGILSPLAYVAVLAAYQLAPVAVVAPAREASVVLIALAGWLIFREPHPARRLLGSVVVLAGIALLALG